MNQPLLTAQQAAQLLNVPTSWVREATRANRIPYIALGRYRRYEQPALEAWIAQNRAGTQPADLPSRRS